MVQAECLTLERIFILSILENGSKLRNRPYINLPVASYISFGVYFFFLFLFSFSIYAVTLARELFSHFPSRNYGQYTGSTLICLTINASKSIKLLENVRIFVEKSRQGARVLLYQLWHGLFFFTCHSGFRIFCGRFCLNPLSWLCYIF